MRNIGIKQSFSRKGCPYDIAWIESFHAILKKEKVHHVKYLEYTSAKLAMFQYIEGWYNLRRIHSQLAILIMSIAPVTIPSGMMKICALTLRAHDHAQ